MKGKGENWKDLNNNKNKFKFFKILFFKNKLLKKILFLFKNKKYVVQYLYE